MCLTNLLLRWVCLHLHGSFTWPLMILCITIRVYVKTTALHWITFWGFGIPCWIARTSSQQFLTNAGSLYRVIALLLLLRCYWMLVSVRSFVRFNLQQVAPSWWNVQIVRRVCLEGLDSPVLDSNIWVSDVNQRCPVVDMLFTGLWLPYSVVFLQKSSTNQEPLHQIWYGKIVTFSR